MPKKNETASQYCTRKAEEGWAARKTLPLWRELSETLRHELILMYANGYRQGSWDTEDDGVLNLDLSRLIKGVVEGTVLDLRIQRAKESPELSVEAVLSKPLERIGLTLMVGEKTT